MGRPGAREPIEAGDPPSVAQVRSFFTQRTVLMQRTALARRNRDEVELLESSPPSSVVFHMFGNPERLFVVKGASSQTQVPPC